MGKRDNNNRKGRMDPDSRTTVDTYRHLRTHRRKSADNRGGKQFVVLSMTENLKQ